MTESRTWRSIDARNPGGLGATRALPSPKIKDIQVIETQPGNARLTVVKVLTDQDGLYGYGCATFSRDAPG